MAEILRSATESVRARGLNLAGAAAGAFAAEIDVGSFALTHAGTLRARGVRLVFP